MTDFFEVYDGNGTYGFFLDEKNAERCAKYYEQENYSDDPGHVHIFIASRSFDDFYWTD